MFFRCIFNKKSKPIPKTYTSHDNKKIRVEREYPKSPNGGTFL